MEGNVGSEMGSLESSLEDFVAGGGSGEKVALCGWTE